MTRLHERIETPLPIDETFDFIADFANAMHWDPGVATSERIDAGPVGLGRPLSARRPDARSRGAHGVPDHRPSSRRRRVVLTGSGSGVVAVDEIRFEAATGDPASTTPRTSASGRDAASSSPSLGRAFAKMASDALGGMQRALDERAAAAR